MEPVEFVKLLKPYAVKIQENTGIPWQVIIAQAALETGWLKNPVVDVKTRQKSYNLFNIKGDGPAGSVRAIDSEYVKGRKQKVLTKFRAYNNYEESLRDYARLISKSERYAPAMKAKDNPEEFAVKLQECGYAIDGNYAKKLIVIMRKYMKDTPLAEQDGDEYVK